MSVPTKDEIALAAEQYSPQGWRSGHKRPAFIAGAEFVLARLRVSDAPPPAPCPEQRLGTHQWMFGKDGSEQCECVLCGAKGRIVEVPK